MSRSPRGAAASAMRSGDLLVEGRWMQGAGGRRAFSLACVIGRHRVSASTHAAAAAPFSPASFHSRHIRCDAAVLPAAAAAAARIRLSSATVGVRGERSVTGPAAAWPGRRGPALFCPVCAARVYRTTTIAVSGGRRTGRAPWRSVWLATCAHITKRRRRTDTRTCAAWPAHTHSAVITSRLRWCACVCVFSRYRAAWGEGGSCRGPASAALRHSSSVAIMTCARPPLRQFDPRRCQLAVSATTGHPSIACTQLISPP